MFRNERRRHDQRLVYVFRSALAQSASQKSGSAGIRELADVAAFLAERGTE